MAIPDAILDKPGGLDGPEWEFMRRHTVIGERMLHMAPALSGVARLVRWSHERMDGGGYPDGLRGSEIPLGARIRGGCRAPWRAGRARRGPGAERPRRAGRRARLGVSDGLIAH
jgi:hypothetical protein